MNLNELTASVSAMTPGPWNNAVADWHIHTDDCDDPVAKCDGLNDTAGIVALRNNADALIECAALLRNIIGDSGAVIPDDYMAEARAALARLEGES